MAEQQRGDFWDSYKEIGNLGKNDKGDQIIVALTSKKGKEYVDVRTWYTDKTTQQLAPGKGISIPVDLADEVAQFIMNATESFIK